jgi:hypothetical protein
MLGSCNSKEGSHDLCRFSSDTTVEKPVVFQVSDQGFIGETEFHLQLVLGQSSVESSQWETAAGGS